MVVSFKSGDGGGEDADHFKEVMVVSLNPATAVAEDADHFSC